MTPKQAKFVEVYLTNGRNASAAYRVAYDPKKMAAKTINENASRLLRNSKVAARVTEADAKAAARLEQAADRFAVSKERISKELARLAFADARRFFKWDKGGVEVKTSGDLSDDDAAAVIEVSQTVTDKGGTIRVKVADKRQALMDLARLHGYVVETKNLRVIRSLEDLTAAELEALAAEEGEGTRH